MEKMIKDIKKLDYFELASKPIKEIWEIFNATEEGHSSEKADQVRETYGDNEIDYGTEKSLWRTVVEAYFTPFTLVLFGLAFVSFLTDYVFLPVEEKEALRDIILVLLFLLSRTINLI